MFVTILLALLAFEIGRDADGCPDSETSYGRLLIEAGETCPRIDKERKQEAALEAKRQAVVARFTTRVVSPALKSAIIRKMNLIAIDGPSVRYLWPSQKHPYVYCGFVNGKNRMGGYTGWITFSAQLNDMGGLEELNVDTPEGCSSFGYAETPN